MRHQLTPDLPASFRATIEGLPLILTMQHAPNGRLRVSADVEGDTVGVEVMLDVAAASGGVRRAAVDAVTAEVEHYRASLHHA